MTILKQVELPTTLVDTVKAEMIGVCRIASYGYEIDGDKVDLILIKFHGKNVRLIIEETEKEHNATKED